MRIARNLRTAFDRLPPAIKFWLVSAIGTPFSSFMYWYLMNRTNTGMIWSSRLSSMLAQLVDFYPHKRLTVGEHRHDHKAFSAEMVLYGCQIFAFMWWIEPCALQWVTEHYHYGTMQTWAIAHIFTGSLRFLVIKLVFLPFKEPSIDLRHETVAVFLVVRLALTPQKPQALFLHRAP